MAAKFQRDQQSFPTKSAVGNFDKLLWTPKSFTHCFLPTPIIRYWYLDSYFMPTNIEFSNSQLSDFLSATIQEF